jgi:hypothetical protein
VADIGLSNPDGVLLLTASLRTVATPRRKHGGSIGSTFRAWIRTEFEVTPFSPSRSMSVRNSRFGFGAAAQNAAE